MNQSIKHIKIKDLILWTENPRDPITSNSSNRDVINRALKDDRNKWQLHKLAAEMGAFYDYSELPTVVYHGKKPIVYDGNRRMALGMLQLGIVKPVGGVKFDLPEFRETIPCNVCDKNTGLKNVFRKHGQGGSWEPLERDIFIDKHMNQSKSLFLQLDEATGIISANPHLNQLFVKQEIFQEQQLRRLGFEMGETGLKSVFTNTEAKAILTDLSQKIKDREITTRKNRGQVLEVLDPANRKLIDQKISNAVSLNNIAFATRGDAKVVKLKQSARTKQNAAAIFGGILYLKPGRVSDLYRDISDLYEYFVNNRETLSSSFPGLIRMALRLLIETAANEGQFKDIKPYCSKYFQDAKKTLSSDLKTTLVTQNVTESSITTLLHTGAHSYMSAANLDQTLALSIIIGGIVSLSHGKPTK